MTIVCQICGAEFEAAGKNAKFCIDCKKQRKRDWQRKNYLTRTQGPDIAEKYIAAAKSVKSMNDVLAKADAAGLSYGQYVAEEERKKAMNKKNEAAPAPLPTNLCYYGTSAWNALRARLKNAGTRTDRDNADLS